MYLEINDDHSRLVRDHYRFFVSVPVSTGPVRVTLDRYARLTRPTARHGWRQQEWWEFNVRNGIALHQLKEEPAIPLHIRDRLRTALEQKIEFQLKTSP